MILFDFDGVLIDSVREAAVTAYGAVTGRVATSLDELPSIALRLFEANRFHFQPAGDAVLLMEWCLEERDENRVLTSEAYRDEVLVRGTTPVRERTTRFFDARGRFVSRDPVRWVALNSVYEPLLSSLREIGGEHVVILTNKNRDAVLDLTKHFQLWLNPANVYSGDGGVTKSENLDRIAVNFESNMRNDGFIFVDDCIGNLVEVSAHAEVRGIPLQGALAMWGYVGASDEAAARAKGFLVFQQDDLIARLSQNVHRKGSVDGGTSNADVGSAVNK